MARLAEWTTLADFMAKCAEAPPRPAARKLDLAVDEPSKALENYAEWRPRLRRGATWAGTAAFLSKTMGGNHPGWAHIAVPTIAAGLAGAGDAALESKIRENQRMRRVVERGFEEAHMTKKSSDDTSLFTSSVVDGQRAGNSVLAQLFSQKARLGTLASKQLAPLYPEGARAEGSLGRGARLSSGQVGAVERLFSAAR